MAKIIYQKSENTTKLGSKKSLERNTCCQVKYPSRSGGGGCKKKVAGGGRSGSSKCTQPPSPERCALAKAHTNISSPWTLSWQILLEPFDPHRLEVNFFRGQTHQKSRNTPQIRQVYPSLFFVRKVRTNFCLVPCGMSQEQQKLFWTKKINSVQTRCIVKGEARRSPLFLATFWGFLIFSGSLAL